MNKVPTSTKIILHSKGLVAISKCMLLWILNLLFLFIIGQFIVKLLDSRWERAIYGLFGTLVALLATIIVLKIENRSLKDIGLYWQRSTPLKFFKGIFIGVICFGFLLSMLLFFTPLQIQKNSASISIIDLLSYWPILPLAFMEEIAFRAYPMIRLSSVYGMRKTQIIAAIAFALYHLTTGWSLFAAFLGPGVWAIVFGLSAQWSGGIAMPTGIHVALNILQPLVGMGAGSYTSIWFLDYRQGTTPLQIHRAENVGLILQISILLFAWLATEFYMRTNKKTISAKRPISYTNDINSSIKEVN